MTQILVASPILPGKQEAMRRVMQELLVSRHEEYEASCRRLSITGTHVWFIQAVQGEIIFLSLDAEHLEQILPRFSASDRPFDRWLKRQVQECTGVHLLQPPLRLVYELLFEWRDMTLKGERNASDSN